MEDLHAHILIDPSGGVSELDRSSVDQARPSSLACVGGGEVPQRTLRWRASCSKTQSIVNRVFAGG